MLKIKLENIKIRQDIQDSQVLENACKKFKLPQNSVANYKIIKKSIDARDKNDIFYNYSIIVTLKENTNIKHLKNNKDAIIQEDNKQNILTSCKLENLKLQIIRKSTAQPVIIGAGPAGLFCALTLIENGIKPIIVEQGKTVEERQQDVEKFMQNGELKPLSNVQFGEGGAGTFSDGKLTTNIHNPLCRTVLEEFVKFGAPKQIEYINKPHIGTDNLIKIVANIRKYIIEKGGTFLFNTKAVDFEIENNQITKLICESINTNANINAIDNKSIQILQKSIDKTKIEIKTDTIVLAIGHSSREMFETLHLKNINMEKKNFSVGVRIEHKQSMINKSQYGEKTKLKLPPAEYKLAYHGKDRSCYTFCMCPGGEVIASSSEKGTIVTNGMSKFLRDGENANSAVLVNVTPEEFKGQSVLAGMYFQKDLEEKAFKLGGSNYFAPIQRVEDFINNKKSTFIGKVKPTYKPGVTLTNLQQILPEFVTKTLIEAITYFDTKISGFANPDAILTGVETRSSSPVTIKRNEKLMSNVNGLYPCGEGAGYAGGIMSAAVDGIKVATAILNN